MKNGLLLAAATILLAGGALAEPKYKADVPPSILTPDETETRIGTLRFFDGMPDEATVKAAYDNLDFMRGVETFLNGIPAASIRAMCEGLDTIGVKQGDPVVGIFENLMDARSLFLTANSITVYVTLCFDLEDGPVVMEVPPDVLGPVDDAFFRFVTDVGRTGPDKGKGGKYLLVPPGYEGELPQNGYFIAPSRTYTNWLLMRAFVHDGDVAGAVKRVKDNMRIYRWAERDAPPKTTFVDLTGKKFNTIHANTFEFYEELDRVIQKEPADAFDPELTGLFAAVGIKKGRPFAPDERMKKILTEAVAVGNATARAITFASRDPRAYYFEDRQWKTGFIGGSYQFEDNGERMLDARTLFHYYATGITPAMAAKMVGAGSQYAYAERDSEGRYLDGGRTYRLTLPAPIPAKDFWAVTVYDGQHRSMLETDQRTAGLDSTLPGVKPNDDGSYTLWFGPEAPEGREGNWVQTMPGKSWHVILRLYGPLEPWFDKAWKPGDFELVE